MINPKNNDIKHDITNNTTDDVTVAGTDLFADSESFLNELTDDELEQVRGGAPNSNISLLLCGPVNSTNSIIVCD
ncbi:SapB/AmfS family lanthipeptide [Microcoleus sp. F6_B4]